MQTSWPGLSPATRCYFAFALVFGALLAVATPPFQFPDEPNHLLRIYQLSEGTLIGEKQGDRSGGTLPAAVVDETHRFARLPFNLAARTSWSEIQARLEKSPRLDDAEALKPRVFADFSNTVRYSPLSYLPQTLGLLSCKTVGLTLVQATYVSRLFVLLFTILTTSLAIQLLPGLLGWGLAAVALLPMNLAASASLSTDAIASGLAYLVFALAVWLSRNPTRLNLRLGIAIATVSAVLALSKFVYFLLPIALVVSHRKKSRLVPAIVVWCVSVVMLWALAIRGIQTDLRPGENVSAQAQFKHVLAHPLEFIVVVVKDCLEHRLHYFDSFVGKLGWFDVQLPRWVIVGYFAMLILLWATRERKDVSPFSAAQRIWIFSSAVATFWMLALSQYLTWIPVGAATLEGQLQGRYWLPIAPYFLLTLPTIPFLERIAAKRGAILCVGASLFLTMTLITLVKRYYL